MVVITCQYRDIPTVCFKTSFVKGQKKIADFFACQQCQLNCESCDNDDVFNVLMSAMTVQGCVKLALTFVTKVIMWYHSA